MKSTTFQFQRARPPKNRRKKESIRAGDDKEQETRISDDAPLSSGRLFLFGERIRRALLVLWNEQHIGHLLHQYLRVVRNHGYAYLPRLLVDRLLAPIFGSILADGFFGRYKAILIGSIVCCLGILLMTVGAISTMGKEAMTALSYAGLFTIALATGGIKPCVSAFAADQFPPEMEDERTQYFSFFYFAINLGASISKVITPILRSQGCMGQETCFPLAFGVPVIFMFIALVIFGVGTPWYKITRTSENVIWKVCKCVCYALKKKCGGKEKKDHWLDHSIPKYGAALIDDVKHLLSVMLLFLPVVLFWALYDQQGSTRVLQASHMDGRVGQLTILPDQMGVINPFLVILLLPLFEGVIYPCLAKCNIWTRHLRRMGWGGVLAVVSFVIAGLLQLAVDKTAVVMSSGGRGRLFVSNYLSCNVTVSSTSGGDSFVVPKGQTISGDLSPNASIKTTGSSCGNWSASSAVPIQGNGGLVVALFSSHDPGSILSSASFELKKTDEGKTLVCFVWENRTNQSFNISVVIEQAGSTQGSAKYNGFPDDGGKIHIVPNLLGSNEYEIYLKNCSKDDAEEKACSKTRLKSFNAGTGAALVFVIPAVDEHRLVTVIVPNSVSILWQVPQYVVITIGEILFSVCGLAFSYSQASPKMKSVFQAIWLLTAAFGNALSMGVSDSGMFEGRPALEFFVYATMMGAIMLFFVLLAWRYKFKKTADEPASESGKKKVIRDTTLIGYEHGACGLYADDVYHFAMSDRELIVCKRSLSVALCNLVTRWAGGVADMKALLIRYRLR